MAAQPGSHSVSPSPPAPEPRWPAVLGVLAVALLQFALPAHLRVGPSWLLLVTVCAFLVPLVISHRTGRHSLNQTLAYAMLGLITVTLIGSLGLLIVGLPSHRDTPKDLLMAAFGLWVGNVLTFASWYWRLDAGGPHVRDARHAHVDGAFFFPPMAMDPKLREVMGLRHWRPGFIDYVFLSFNTSTAFSPTDTPVVTRWAKVLTMIQASISLCTIGILAARAVNIL